MNSHQFIGFDVHKKSISYCVRLGDGTIVEEGKIPSRRADMTAWAQARPVA